MPRLKPLYLCLISGVLLVLAWPPLPTAFILFFAFVPLFVLHRTYDNVRRQHVKFWGWAYISMFIFNTGTTWWVWNASPSGCIMMLFLNSLLMSLPFLAYSLTRKAFPKLAWTAFVMFFLGFEYFHFNWSASWPWMTLGKGFASMPAYIQWYEFTGEMGGTALILAVNVLIASIVINRQYKKLWQPAALVLVFGLISWILGQQGETGLMKVRPFECVISQPNIDPYEEKFDQNNVKYLYPEIQIEYGIEVAKPFMDNNTDILLFPETAIVGGNDEGELDKSELMKPLLQLTDSSQLRLLAGAESYALFKQKEKPSITARYDSFGGTWFDSYNTALLLENKKVSNIYHKSRLVPGVEKMPFEFLEALSIQLGGTTGSLGVSKKPINFTLRDNVKIAPLICYESVFGDYTNEFVRDGANMLAVITNDGWWGETPGYAQHLLFGAIRCIETRREMIRSANTGVSAKIDRFGRITHKTRYKERIAFKCEANAYDNLTFYVKYGNIIGKLGSVLAILILLAAIFRLAVSARRS